MKTTALLLALLVWGFIFQAFAETPQREPASVELSRDEELAQERLTALFVGEYQKSRSFRDFLDRMSPYMTTADERYLRAKLAESGDEDLGVISKRGPAEFAIESDGHLFRFRFISIAKQRVSLNNKSVDFSGVDDPERKWQMLEATLPHDQVSWFSLFEPEAKAGIFSKLGEKLGLIGGEKATEKAAEETAEKTTEKTTEQTAEKAAEDATTKSKGAKKSSKSKSMLRRVVEASVVAGSVTGAYSYCTSLKTNADLCEDAQSKLNALPKWFEQKDEWEKKHKLAKGACATTGKGKIEHFQVDDDNFVWVQGDLNRGVFAVTDILSEMASKVPRTDRACAVLRSVNGESQLERAKECVTQLRHDMAYLCIPAPNAPSFGTALPPRPLRKEDHNGTSR